MRGTLGAYAGPLGALELSVLEVHGGGVLGVPVGARVAPVGALGVLGVPGALGVLAAVEALGVLGVLKAICAT